MTRALCVVCFVCCFFGCSEGQYEMEQMKRWGGGYAGGLCARCCSEQGPDTLMCYCNHVQFWTLVPRPHVQLCSCRPHMHSSAHADHTCARCPHMMCALVSGSLPSFAHRALRAAVRAAADGPPPGHHGPSALRICTPAMAGCVPSHPHARQGLSRCAAGAACARVASSSPSPLHLSHA